VGSQRFLEVGVGRYGKQGEFEFLPKLVSNEEVFFGFSLSSECKAYAPYLRARAKELRASNQLDDMLKKHVASLTENNTLASVSSLPVVETQLASETEVSENVFPLDSTD